MDVNGTSPRHFVGGTLFIMASMLFCWYWVAFPLSDMYFVDGYTRIGTPPAPNNWKSSRYSWEWWHIWLLGLNMLLPYLLASAMLNNELPEWSRIHYFCARILLLVNTWAFVGLSVQWLFLCNNSLVPWATACNDKRWCGVYFASSVSAAEWCPNTTPFFPDVTGDQLSRSGEFFQAWLFSLLFILWALAHRAVNAGLRQSGMFQEGSVE